MDTNRDYIAIAEAAVESRVDGAGQRFGDYITVAEAAEAAARQRDAAFADYIAAAHAAALTGCV